MQSWRGRRLRYGEDVSAASLSRRRVTDKAPLTGVERRTRPVDGVTVVPDTTNYRHQDIVMSHDTQLVRSC